MSALPQDSLIGQVVDGRYEVLSRIARGGMATVYRALDRRLDRVVALKVMHPHLSEGAAGSEFIARFRREARAAARLAHPGLVAVFDQGLDDGVSYLTMEYVEGSDLRRLLTERGTLSVKETLATLTAVLDALSVAHRAHLVHRDVKPENILIARDGTLKLADFGLARAVSEVTATTTGTVLGTVAYLAPEVITTGASDTRTDVYAIGILAYEMLTGTPPHTGTTPIQVAYSHVNKDAPALSETLDWVPEELDTFVAAMIARDPDDRPTDADEALALLQRTEQQLPPEILERRHDLGRAPNWDKMITGTVPDDPDATTQIRANRPGSTVPFPLGQTSAEETDSSESPDSPAAAESPEKDATEERPSKRRPKPPRRQEAQEAQRTQEATTPRRRRWPFLLIFLLLVAGLTAGAWWYQTEGPGSYVTVPEGLEGVPLANATAILTERGLTPTQTEAHHDSVAEGLVITSVPASGEQVKRESTVELVISLGPRMSTVPTGILGAAQADAEAQISNAGFTLAPTQEEHYDDQAAGIVTALTGSDGEPIEEGATVRHDTVLQLTVSAGPAPVTIPKVVGLDAAAAQSVLAEAGLVYVEAEPQYSDTVARGVVLAQEPAADAAGHRTDTVTVTLSLGHAPVVVPNVSGWDADAAAAKLQELGFTTSFYEPLAVSPLNMVFGLSLPNGQSVSAGDTLEYGSAIVIQIV